MISIVHPQNPQTLSTMNSRLSEPMIDRQDYHEWVPLITQQMRLRRIQQIFAYNIQTENVEDVIYFTLHQSVMSAPFYTSERLLAFSNPKFKEFQVVDDGQDGTLLSSGTLVLRIWIRNSFEDGMDSILLTWGINLSGLVYLGTKRSAIQPEFFHSNTLIFALRSSGYFTHFLCVKPTLSKPLPFIDSINVQSNLNSMHVYRLLYLRQRKSEISNSYSVEKLRHLRLLQLRLRNRTLDTNHLRRVLTNKSGERSMHNIKCKGEKSIDSSDTREKNDSMLLFPTIRYAPQLLTMNTLNKMLKFVPTTLQKNRIKALVKNIECAKSVNRLLINERDKKTAQVRKLKEKYCKLYDDHEELNSQLMEILRQLGKNKEHLKNQKIKQALCKELLTDQLNQLTTRRMKLLLELLDIYPILNLSGKYYICGAHLPNSDALNDISDDSISIALGYIAHVLKMYEYFFQLPLRYAITHRGSQSYICDHIAPSFVMKDRNFPLFTRGKDRIQFNYAVYLLNKNIAQLRWMHGQNSPNLRSTLSNLSDLLSGKDKNDGNKGSKSSSTSKSTPISASIMDVSRNSAGTNNAHHTQRSVNETPITMDDNEIFAVPEAYLSRQLSEQSLHRYIEHLERSKIHYVTKSIPKVCGTSSAMDNMGNVENIEEGTDILALSLKSMESDALEHDCVENILILDNQEISNVFAIQPRLSKSVGSYPDDEQFNNSAGFIPDLTLRGTRYDTCSEPVVNEDISQSGILGLSDVTDSVGIKKQEAYLRQWLETGPALVCSEDYLYPDEVLGVTACAPPPSTSIPSDTPLTVRTNALLATKTFNMVKPKH